MKHPDLPSAPSADTEAESRKITLSTALQSEIEHWLAKYPSNQRQSAIIPALLIAQRHHCGWLPRALLDAVADYIRMPRMAVYEVATFYSMLELKPVGRHKISICTNVPCMLNGCNKLVQYLQRKLNIKFGETTIDQQFTLKEVECLGACVRAPVMLVDGCYYEDLTEEKVNKILKRLAKPKDTDGASNQASG